MIAQKRISCSAYRPLLRLPPRHNFLELGFEFDTVRDHNSLSHPTIIQVEGKVVDGAQVTSFSVSKIICPLL